VTPFLYIISGAALLLLGLMIWALRGLTGKRRRGGLEEQARSNIQYFSQIQQALSREDREFVRAKGGPDLAGSMGGERRKVARDFLKALDKEFTRLLRLARVIATLSPEVAPLQEFERMRLSAMFHWRLRVIRIALALGASPRPQLSVVSDIVSRLNVQIQTAMKELGERAALAAELASAVDRSDGRLA
jgi:hypothetical protein